MRPHTLVRAIARPSHARRSFARRLLALGVSAAAAISLTACGTGPGGGGGGALKDAGQPLKLGLSMPALDTPFFSVLVKGATTSAEAAGGSVVQTTNANRDAGQQVTDFRNLITAGANAIMAGIVDTKAIKPALDYAASQNVPVVIVDDEPGAGEIADESGGADILVNNAGLVGSYDALTDIDVERWHAIIAVNQTGVFYGMRSIIPLMKSRGGGSIINVSSIWGLVGAPGVAAYQASKGAVTLMTKNAAMSYAPDGIRVNSVHPGLITTPMTEAQDPAISEGLVATTPLGRAGRAEEVANAILFLASDEASYVTGSQLVVDGGFTTP